MIIRQEEMIDFDRILSMSIDDDDAMSTARSMT
jgi:hypothetical protein